MNELERRDNDIQKTRPKHKVPLDQNKTSQMLHSLDTLYKNPVAFPGGGNFSTNRSRILPGHHISDPREHFLFNQAQGLYRRDPRFLMDRHGVASGQGMDMTGYRRKQFRYRAQDGDAGMYFHHGIFEPNFVPSNYSVDRRLGGAPRLRSKIVGKMNLTPSGPQKYQGNEGPWNTKIPTLEKEKMESFEDEEDFDPEESLREKQEVDSRNHNAFLAGKKLRRGGISDVYEEMRGVDPAEEVYGRVNSQDQSLIYGSRHYNYGHGIDSVRTRA